MDKEGNKCKEKLAFGCKVTHKITSPDMILVMDEVGADTSQKGDGAVGNEKFVCARGSTPKEKCARKAKHWTLIGLPALDGSPVMCVIIYAGKERNPLMETGMDMFAPVIGEAGDPNFFEDNCGKGKLYPGCPTCMFKEKFVPTLVRWTPKGSVTGDILVEIVKTLDVLEIYAEDRRKVKTPFILLDGHGSRWELPDRQI